MKSSFILKVAAELAVLSLPGAAFAQAAWTPGSEIVGQPVQVTTNGVTNTVTLSPGGQAQILTPSGHPTPGTWTAVNGQLCHHVRMDLFNHLLLQSAPPDIRLVGGDNQQIADGLEPSTGCRNIRKNLKFGQTRWRIGFGVALQRTVDDTIAIEEYCTAHYDLFTSSTPTWSVQP